MTVIKTEILTTAFTQTSTLREALHKDMDAIGEFGIQFARQASAFGEMLTELVGRAPALGIASFLFTSAVLFLINVRKKRNQTAQNTPKIQGYSLQNLKETRKKRQLQSRIIDIYCNDPSVSRHFHTPDFDRGAAKSSVTQRRVKIARQPTSKTPETITD